MRSSMYSTHILATVLALASCVPQATSADVLDDIWTAWRNREVNCGDIRMEYTSHIIRTIEDPQTRQSRRSTSQGATTVHFTTDGRIRAETVVEETNTTDNRLGKGTTLEITCEDMDLTYYVGGPAIIRGIDGRGRHRTSEVGVLYQVMCLSAAAEKAAYTKELPTELGGKQCVVVSRSYEHSKDHTASISLYLREDLGFLPIKTIFELRNAAGVDSNMTTTISYDRVDGIYVPKVWTIDQSLGINTPPALKVRTTALRKSLQLNLDLAPDVFQVELATGTQLRDFRGDSPAKEVLSEPRTIRATTAR